MTDAGAASDNEVVIKVFLDGETEPLTQFNAPETFTLDTNKLPDGLHTLRVEAKDQRNVVNVREVKFFVHNGPAITVSGLSEGDEVKGEISILVNAYGGEGEVHFEPRRAETPAPIPTWAWVLFLAIVAWAIWYLTSQWSPPPQFANTPTYGGVAPQPSPPSDAGPPSAAKKTTEAGKGTFAWQEKGLQIYNQNCAACHQQNGQGVPGVFPPLKGNKDVLASDPTQHIEVILNGQKGEPIDGVSYAAEMPPWKDKLSDEEIAAVVNHERMSWGNQAPTVTPAQIAAERSRGRK
ncbi:MAG: c-type cytochrome [Candidatus Tectomicrobia bacterium]|uniref:C-type cytochrome n=1 Tax=Tectimicrobiota bacterium TaxID=2528274 RepID=A0A932M1A2_UNCTE|nr:c-type cytochrome [Candidatus Tectomicrobia bacterium]